MHDDEEIIGEIGGPKFAFEFFIHADGFGVLNLITPGGQRVDRILIKEGRFVQDEDWIRLNNTAQKCNPSPDRRTAGLQSEALERDVI